MMSRSLSAHSPQMTGLWWEVHNLSGEIDCSMGRDMCDFDDKYNINKSFFSSLVDMNTLPNNDDGRHFSLKTFILPKKIDTINHEITVIDQVRHMETCTMVNTGPTALYVGQHVGLVPPLSLKDVYSATATETGDEYIFPQTVAVEQYNTELNILLKYLTVLDHRKRNDVNPTKTMEIAERLAMLMSENKIFAEMDTTGFNAKGEALLYLLELFTESCRKIDPAIEYQNTTMLTDIGSISNPETHFEEIVKAVERIYRNPLCIWMKPLHIVTRCRVDKSHESLNTDVGLIPVAPGGSCKIIIR